MDEAKTWMEIQFVFCETFFDRTAIRLAMLYGAECWPTKIRHVQQLSVVEMRLLRWICSHIRMDRVRNDDIRDRLEVV